ncbi:metacaspase-4-like [Lotus japonicus]|uniref:metacaspase-4-like n=1 Tax=Lotus japonicus TaxID=34305 RepID=UPI00258CCAEE|nr:metacaspase-4-like [Lotus japonicus]
MDPLPEMYLNKKKAVLIGLKHPDPQMNSVDVKGQILRMKENLMKLRGFSEDNITLMIQEEEEEEEAINTPTGRNIGIMLGSLVRSAKPGDILYVHLIAYGCSDGCIITADKYHLRENRFRGFIVSARRKGCNLTMVSDCLIEPAACSCSFPIKKPTLFQVLMERQPKKEDLFPVRHDLSTMDLKKTLQRTDLCSVDVRNPIEETDDDDLPRVILLMPFRRDQNTPSPIQSRPQTGPLNEKFPSELFFPPSPKGGASSTTTSPPHTLYGGFTNAILDVIEETHGEVTNLQLAQKAMEKLGGEVPSLRCNDPNHAYASFVC